MIRAGTVLFGQYVFVKPVAWPSSLCPFSFVERINSSENQIVPFALKEGALFGPTFGGAPLEVANSPI